MNTLEIKKGFIINSDFSLELQNDIFDIKEVNYIKYNFVKYILPNENYFTTQKIYRTKEEAEANIVNKIESQIRITESMISRHEKIIKSLKQQLEKWK